MTDHNALGVTNIQQPGGEEFQHDQMLGRASPQAEAGAKRKDSGAADHLFLERQGAQGDVDPDFISRPQQQDATLVREFPSVCDTRRPGGEQRVDERTLFSKTGEKRQIDCQGHARLAPTLYGDPAKEARTPGSFVAEGL